MENEPFATVGRVWKFVSALILIIKKQFKCQGWLKNKSLNVEVHMQVSCWDLHFLSSFV